MACATCEENARKANKQQSISYGVLQSAANKLMSNADKYTNQREEQYLQKLEQIHTIRNLGNRK